jgi:hypothetical protein
MTKSKLFYSVILLLPLTVFAAEQVNEMSDNPVTVQKMYFVPQIKTLKCA